MSWKLCEYESGLGESSTTSWPVTRTRMLAWLGLDGCASRVEILCSTFWNGRAWSRRGSRVEGRIASARGASHRRISSSNQEARRGTRSRPHLQLLDDAVCALELLLLECEHGVVALCTGRRGGSKQAVRCVRMMDGRDSQGDAGTHVESREIMAVRVKGSIVEPRKGKRLGVNMSASFAQTGHKDASATGCSGPVEGIPIGTHSVNCQMEGERGQHRESARAATDMHTQRERYGRRTCFAMALMSPWWVGGHSQARMMSRTGAQWDRAKPTQGSTHHFV